MRRDYFNNKIKLFSSTLDITDNLGLDSNPWDISAVDSNTAVVTLPGLKQLQFIQIIPSLKAGQTIQLDKRCWGVDVKIVQEFLKYTYLTKMEKIRQKVKKSKKISNYQELIQSDPTSCPQK